MLEKTGKSSSLRDTSQVPTVAKFNQQTFSVLFNHAVNCCNTVTELYATVCCMSDDYILISYKFQIYNEFYFEWHVLRPSLRQDVRRLLINLLNTEQ